MSYKTIIIHREELYEQVWTTPMLQLARQYEMSDVGLAKICKKMEIPKPGRGYWAKQQNGFKVSREKLRKLSKTGKDKIVIYRRSQLIDKQIPVNPIVAQLKEKPKISVAASLTQPHPLVEKAEKFLANTKVNENGILVPSQQSCLSIRVSPNNAQRALCIMDALIKELEGLGYSIITHKNDSSYTRAVIQDQEVKFSLEEKCRRIDHVWTPEELKSKEKIENAKGFDERSLMLRLSLMSVPKYDFVPSGVLTFTIDEPTWYSTQRVWKDGKTQRLEDSINTIAGGLIQTATEIIAKEREWQLRAEAEKRERERALRLQELREIEQKKIDALINDTEKWHNSQKIKAYLLAVEKAHASSNPSVEQIEWLKWAKDYADYLDPLTESEYRVPTLED